MEDENTPKKVFNKKVFLIIVAVIVMIGVGGGVAMLKASNNPTFCISCHIMKPYYQSWHDGSLLAAKHAKAGVTCHDCHTSSIAGQAQEGIKYISGNYKTPLDKRNFGTRAFCLKCHSASGTGSPKGMTFETAEAKTNFAESNPHANHNGEQDCNVCHSMHSKSKVMCAQCHQFQWMNKLDSSNWVTQ